MYLYAGIKYPLVYECAHDKKYLLLGKNSFKEFLKNPFTGDFVISGAIYLKLIGYIWRINRKKTKILNLIFNYMIKKFFKNIKSNNISHLVLYNNGQYNRLIARECYNYGIRSIHLIHGIGNLINTNRKEQNVSDFIFVWSQAMKDKLVIEGIKKENEVFVCGYSRRELRCKHSKSDDIVIIGQPIFNEDSLMELNQFYNKLKKEYCTIKKAEIVYKPHPLEKKNHKHHLKFLTHQYGFKILDNEQEMLDSYDKYIVFDSTYSIELLLYNKKVYKYDMKTRAFDLSLLGVNMTFSTIAELIDLIEKEKVNEPNDYYIKPFVGCREFSRIVEMTYNDQ